MFRTPLALFAATAVRHTEVSSGAASSSASAAPLNTGDLKHHLKTRDLRLNVPTKNRLVSVSFVSTRALLAETIVRHELLPRTAAFVPFLQNIGTQLSFTHLLASPLTGEERVEARLTTDEATIHTAALGLGEGFGYIRPTYNVQLLERGDIQIPFPLKVDRVLYKQSQPFSSMVSASLEEMLVLGEAEREEVKSRVTSPPLSLGLSSLAASGTEEGGDGEASTTDSQAWYPSVQDVVDYFSHNSTLHAYNYFRRSDGIPSAVWTEARVSAALLAAADLLNAQGEPTERNRLLTPHTEAELTAATAQLNALKAQLRTAIPFSFGIQLAPLAAGAEVEWQLWTLQRALTAAAAAANHTEHASPPLLVALLQNAQASHTICQTVLSLLTGDVEGTYAVTKSSRQYTCEPAEMARLVEPVRAQLGINDFTVSLEAEATTRTPLDFFCRCSKANMMSSFTSLPEASLAPLMTQTSFQCATCARHHVVTEEDWANVRAARAASKLSSS